MAKGLEAEPPGDREGVFLAVGAVCVCWHTQFGKGTQSRVRARHLAMLSCLGPQCNIMPRQLPNATRPLPATVEFGCSSGFAVGSVDELHLVTGMGALRTVSWQV